MSKICIFASHYLPYLGGIERYTYNLSKALLEKGDQVLVVTCNDIKGKDYEIMDGIGVLRLPCYNFMGGRYPVTRLSKKFFRLYRRLCDCHFDLVLINARFYPHTLLGAWFAKRNKIKSLILDHGTSHMTVGKKIPDLLFAFVEHMITLGDKLLCRNYYGVSKACCEWLTHFHIQAKGILYNAVDAKYISEIVRDPHRDFRKEYGLSQNTEIIVYTGRLIKEKGVFKLIRAVKDLSSKWDICLFIAGDGEEMDRVRSMEDEHIIPLGRLQFEEIVSLLGQADIYCFPTDYPEGFPTVVLEAAAAGCYVITTDRGGSRELICDESYGMILKNTDVDTIRQGIEYALQYPEERKKAARKAEKKVNDMFTWDKTAEKIHDLAEER